MIIVTLAILAVLLSLGWGYSYQQSKSGNFFTNTQFLWPLGIYVWGDGLILFPAWMGLLLVWINTTTLFTFRVLALFYLVRSAYEVIYWLQHQAVKSSYKPPLPPFFAWLNAEQAAILYQLAHTLTVVIMAAAFISTF